MITTFAEIGEEIVVGGWGRCYETQIRDTIKGLKVEDEVLSVLSYIAKMLRPISKIAQLQIDAKEQKKREERDKDREKRKVTTKPLRKKLKEMRKLSDEKPYRRILCGISSLLWGFEHYNIDWYLEKAKLMIEKPISEWQEKELLTLSGIGKVRLAAFLKWRASR